MTFAHAIAHLTRGLILATLVLSPLLAVQTVRAGHENVIEGDYDSPKAAGLVLMVSLRRAR